MKSNFFLMAIFCLISNVTCSMYYGEPDLSSFPSISLTQENKDKFLSFIKNQLVKQGEFPESANVSLEKFVQDKDFKHPELGQRYIIKIVATWITYVSVHREPGLYVLRPQSNGIDIYSHVFDSGLRAAGINLPKSNN